MPQVAIGLAVAAAGYGAGAAAAGLAATGVMTAGAMAGASFLSGASSVLMGLGTSLAIGGALDAMAPKPKEQAASAQKRTIQSSAVPVQIFYGLAEVPLKVLKVWSHGNDGQFLGMLLYAASQESEEIVGIKINNKYVRLVLDGNTSGFQDDDWIPDKTHGTPNNGGGRSYWQDDRPRFSIRFFKGSPGQTIDAYSVRHGGTTITNNTKIGGITCARMTLYYHPNVWRSLPNVTLIAKGRKVLDPRSGTTAWTENSALIIADFAKHPLASSKAPTVDDATTIAAANACDGAVGLKAGGSIPRYRCQAVITSLEQPDQVLQRLLASMAGTLVNTGGVLKMYAGVARTPVGTIGPSDLTGPIRVLADRPRAELANSATAWYEDQADNHLPKETPRRVDEAGYLADGSRDKPMQLQLPTVPHGAQAQRITKIALETNRQRGTIELPVRRRFVVHEAMDVLELTLPDLGLSAAKYVIHSRKRRPQSSDVVLTMSPYSDTPFAWTPSTDELTASEPLPVDLPSPITQVPAGPALTLAQATRPLPGDVSSYSIRASWTVPDDPSFWQLEIEWRTTQRAIVDNKGRPKLAQGKTAPKGVSYITPWRGQIVSPASGAMSIDDVVPFALYEVRARYRSEAMAGAWTTTTLWTNKASAWVDQIRDVKARPVGLDQVKLTWTLPPVRDIREVQVYYSQTAQLSEARLIETTGKARAVTVDNIALGAAFFWIRYVEGSGAISSWHLDAPVRATMVSKLGKLSGKDKIGSEDIIPGAALKMFAGGERETASVGTSFKLLDEQTITIPNNDDARGALLLLWFIGVGAGQAATSVEVEPRIDGVRINNITVAKQSGVALKYWAADAASVRPGERKVQLYAKTAGGSSTVNGRLIALGFI